MFKTLRSSIGDENVSQKNTDRVAYNSDASRIRGDADTIVWPKTTEDIRHIISYVKRHKLNLVPRGAGTGLAGGAVPQKSVIMDLCKMDKIIIKDDKAIVQPGVVLDDLNSASEFVLPVEPGSHTACTIGGMIATNAAGMRAFKYGKMIDWIEELQIIDGTGKLLKITGDKIKNFCGLEGTTGIVVEARLKLTKLPKERSISIFSFDTINPLVEKFNELKKENVLALEYVDRLSSNIIDFEDSNHLIVEYEGGEGNIKGKEMQDVWKMRDGLYPAVASKGYIVIEDPQIPLESIDKFLYWLQKNEIPTFGHIGIGVVHPHFKKDSNLIEEMFVVVNKLKGSVSGEHGIGLIKKPYMDEKTIENIRKLKEVYDPNNILNGGKLI
ncbi:MAG: FAD-binding oxidoreductase [Nanoarchaeota archaeon]|nr:FAD-binding oxidoreductase [Nanoarchaeota archaeon]